VNDDLAEGLGHSRIIVEKQAEVNRAFSARGIFLTPNLGRCPRLE
jgi:hypothetical protein